MKNITFLTGLPRAGNTLFASLLNQNKNITTTPNSIVADLLHESFKCKHNVTYQNFPDEKSMDLYCEKIIPTYYESFKSDFIIDRGPWGSPGNLMLLYKYLKQPLKFIVLTRPLIDVLVSFVAIQKIKKKDCEKHIKKMLDNKHILGLSIWSIQNLINESQVDKDLKLHFVNYENLVKQPEKEIKQVCKFIGVKYKKIKTKKLLQLSINNVEYDDTVHKEQYPDPFHTIRTDKIKRKFLDPKKYLTKEVIEKYKDIKI